MISVNEAEAIIQSHLLVLKKKQVEIVQAVGCLLAEDVQADRDLPPFHRASMDGIAIAYDSFQSGRRNFALEGTQAAGMSPLRLSAPSNALEVMTGATMPLGTDTVIRYEDIAIENQHATVMVNEATANQNVHRQGQDAHQGDTLLKAGTQISPAEIALLASVGKGRVEVFEFPRTAVISTGNELVAIDELPQPWQIRRSNAYAIQAALAEMKHPCDLFHLEDDKVALERELTSIFASYPLVILSGGVSKGKFDFIPEVLQTLGVKKLFHQVSQKPGKPFWFGKSENQIVFALPGNPVSTYLCFYRYIKPWLKKSAGIQQRSSHAMLARDFTFKPALSYFLQVRVSNEGGKIMAHPVEGGGSGDFANLSDVDGFIELPPERSLFKVGEVFPFISFRQ